MRAYIVGQSGLKKLKCRYIESTAALIFLLLWGGESSEEILLPWDGSKVLACTYNMGSEGTAFRVSNDLMCWTLRGSLGPMGRV